MQQQGAQRLGPATLKRRVPPPTTPLPKVARPETWTAVADHSGPFVTTAVLPPEQIAAALRSPARVSLTAPDAPSVEPPAGRLALTRPPSASPSLSKLVSDGARQYDAQHTAPLQLLLKTLERLAPPGDTASATTVVQSAFVRAFYRLRAAVIPKVADMIKAVDDRARQARANGRPVTTQARFNVNDTGIWVHIRADVDIIDGASYNLNFWADSWLPHARTGCRSLGLLQYLPPPVVAAMQAARYHIDPPVLVDRSRLSPDWLAQDGLPNPGLALMHWAAHCSADGRHGTFLVLLRPPSPSLTESGSFTRFRFRPPATLKRKEPPAPEEPAPPPKIARTWLPALEERYPPPLGIPSEPPLDFVRTPFLSTLVRIACTLMDRAPALTAERRQSLFGTGVTRATVREFLTLMSNTLSPGARPEAWPALYKELRGRTDSFRHAMVAAMLCLVLFLQPRGAKHSGVATEEPADAPGLVVLPNAGRAYELAQILRGRPPKPEVDAYVHTQRLAYGAPLFGMAQDVTPARVIDFVSQFYSSTIHAMAQSGLIPAVAERPAPTLTFWLLLSAMLVVCFDPDQIAPPLADSDLPPQWFSILPN